MFVLNKTVVAIAAHPDDLEFTCTGTLSKLKNLGYEIIYVIVTNGENGFKFDKNISPEKRASIRVKEQLQVAEKLGVKEVVFLNHTDGFLEYTEGLRHKLVEIIKKNKPEIVFSFDPANRDYNNLNLLHRDHRIVSEAAYDACFAAKNLHMYPGERHQINKIYFFGSNKPNHFEDISNQIDLKLELLACHKSQFPDFSKVESYIKTTVSKETDRYEYSEAFRILEVEQIT
jgi:LmbE family N-acetylglucosaminyl deacetylase